jgi:trk system potassium uptake protein TrkH
MVVAGTNFALFWHVLRGDTDALVDNEEFRAYAGIMAVLTAFVTVLLFTPLGLATIDARVAPITGLVEPSLRHAAFQIVSIVTTTGYASMDFNTWGPTAQYVLLFAMFVGGSAGSTGGAIKIVRWVVILKSIRRELFTTVHPEAVRPVRLAGKALDERALRGIYGFTLLYVVIFFVGVAVLSLDTARVGYDVAVFETMSAVAATLGNVGPGFGVVGPMNSYIDFAASSKLFMVFLMWAGRLEIFPVFVLLTRAYWRT